MTQIKTTRKRHFLMGWNENFFGNLGVPTTATTSTSVGRYNWRSVLAEVVVVEDVFITSSSCLLHHFTVKLIKTSFSKFVQKRPSNFVSQSRSCDVQRVTENNFNALKHLFLSLPSHALSHSIFLFFTSTHMLVGREPWSSGYGSRLTIQWSWVRIPVPDTGWTFHIDLL